MGLGANGAPLTDVASVLSNMNSVPVSTPINGTVAPVATPLLATAVPAPLSWGGITNQVPIQTLQQVIPQQEQQIGHFQVFKKFFKSKFFEVAYPAHYFPINIFWYSVNRAVTYLLQSKYWTVSYNTWYIIPIWRREWKWFSIFDKNLSKFFFTTNYSTINCWNEGFV